MSLKSNNDWVECAKWINSLNCLPLQLKLKLNNNQLQLSEFASSLRDGELLCDLLNQLIPGCIDSSLINRRAQMSQLLCLNNIRLFLNICKSPQFFKLQETDLFDEHMLYNLEDLANVIRTLSIISKSDISIKKTESFFLASELNKLNFKQNESISKQSSLNVESNDNHNDDIYYNIVPTEPEAVESYYTDESFLFNTQNTLNDKNDNDNVYQSIVSASNTSHQHQPLKRDYVMREILYTEENFLDGLNTLMNDFLLPLSKVLNQQDRFIIFTNMESLINLHTNLYNSLKFACKGGQGRTIRICNVFESFKVELMKEYAEYFSSIDRSVSKCDSLIQVSLNSINDQSKQLYIAEFRAKLDECKRNSKRGNFKLTDLLKLPYQRVLKYHLLFNELLKQTDVEHNAKEVIEKTKNSMCEVGNYLNECQRDKENLSRIEQLLKHLVINNSNDSSRLSNSSSVYSSSNCSLNLLKDYGHYIKDDKFRVKSIDSGEKFARTRSFFLFEKALILCKLKGNYYNFKETILINEYSIEDQQIPTSVNLISQSSTTIISNLLSNNLPSINQNLTTSSINLSSSSNSHSLYLINQNNNKSYMFIFKNKEQKKLWKDSLIKAKEKMRPNGQQEQKHFFELTNFERDLVKCFVCDKYLLGLFYQGYKCSLCSSISHKDCLTKINTICNAVNRPPTRILSQTQVNNKPDIKLQRSLSNTSSFFPSFCAKAIFKYDGRPAPPEQPVLIFNAGDIIQVVDDDDDEWWRGYKTTKTKLTKEEGFFPRRYVKVIQNTPPLSESHVTATEYLYESYPWFSPVDRFVADSILNRIQNDPTDTIFMVRCRNEGGYAISIKHRGIVDHIKININDFNNLSPTPLIIRDDQNDINEQAKIYSIDQQHNFNSIVSLVNYYSENLLKDNFPQLDTTLGIPFKKALPPVISRAIAKHDFDPSRNPTNNGEQIELKKGKEYCVLHKELNGWWRVYNNEGLIGYVPGSYLQENVIEN